MDSTIQFTIRLVLTLLSVAATHTFDAGVPVFIEEEHHEVIPHWVDAIRSADWLKADLIHIDGHSDMDYPELVDDLPLGHVPMSSQQVSAMMQRNDQFIQSAIMANLIRSAYIILPTWTSNGSGIFNASLGQTLTNFTDKYQLCLCLTEQKRETLEICQTRTLASYEMELVIPTELCAPRISSYKYVELNSRSAARGALHRLLPKEDSVPLIIDIDEDFFGVQLVGSVLLQHGWDVPTLYEISYTLHEILCPPAFLTGVEELQIDSWFRETIKSLTTAGCFTRNICLDLHDNCSFPLTCQAEIYRSLATLHPRWRCKNMDSVLFHMERLVMLLSYQDVKAFESLAEVGICLEVASRTHKNEPKIGLCLGHNIPGASIVPEYVPTYANIVELAKNLTRILRATLPRRPTVITIARSSRDGYVVRKFQRLIELATTLVLKRVFNLTDENFHYSKYLAGGRVGWIERYRKPVNI